MFPRILSRVTFFRIGLAGVVSVLVSFRRYLIYDLALLSVEASREASASASLIADEIVFSICLFTATAIELLLFGCLLFRPFVQPLLLGFLSRHSQSSSF